MFLLVQRCEPGCIVHPSEERVQVAFFGSRKLDVAPLPPSVATKLASAGKAKDNSHQAAARKRCITFASPRKDLDSIITASDTLHVVLQVDEEVLSNELPAFGQRDWKRKRFRREMSGFVYSRLRRGDLAIRANAKVEEKGLPELLADAYSPSVLVQMQYIVFKYLELSLPDGRCGGRSLGQEAARIGKEVCNEQACFVAGRRCSRNDSGRARSK